MSQHAKYESVTTASSELVEQYLQSRSRADSVESLAVVHYRGGQQEFDLGLRYVGSTDPLERAVGAEVLAQLGWGEQSFRDESIEALFPLLNDPDDDVVYAAAVALGHRRATCAIQRLAELARHPNPQVR